jgi:hypothetical protein
LDIVASSNSANGGVSLSRVVEEGGDHDEERTDDVALKSDATLDILDTAEPLGSSDAVPVLQPPGQRAECSKLR